jgi:hypothetical protein
MLVALIDRTFYSRGHRWEARMRPPPAVSLLPLAGTRLKSCLVAWCLRFAPASLSAFAMMPTAARWGSYFCKPSFRFDKGSVPKLTSYLQVAHYQTQKDTSSCELS